MIICTGNSCRSPMAEGYLKSFDQAMEVYSAGIYPESSVSQRAVQVLKEDGVDISAHHPKHVNNFTDQPFDWVITVCDFAREHSPAFTGNVIHELHHNFEDPWIAMGSDEEKMDKYRQVRDQIKAWFRKFYDENLKG